MVWSALLCPSFLGATDTNADQPLMLNPRTEAMELNIHHTHIGPDGKVPVFDLVEKKMVRRYPIDAREMVARGVAEYRGQQNQSNDAARPGPGSPADDMVDFRHYTVTELRKLAATVGIAGAHGMTKSALVAALANTSPDMSVLDDNSEDSDDEESEG